MAARQRQVNGFLVLAFLIFGALEIAPVKAYYAEEKQDWRGAAQILDAYVLPGDAVIGWREWCLTYYYAGDLQPIQWKNETAALRTIQSAYATHDRMWFVHGSGLAVKVDRTGSIRRWLGQEGFLLIRLPAGGETPSPLWLWFKRRAGLSAEESKVEMVDLLEDVIQLYAGRTLPQKAALYQTIETLKSTPANELTAQEHARLGKDYAEAQSWEMAIVEYQEAITLAPSVAKYYVSLGNAYRNKKMWQAAVIQYHKALDLDPRLADAHVGLGLTWQAQGQFHDAIAAFQQATVLDPKHGFAYRLLGDAYHAIGWPDEAIVAYEQALAVSPGFAHKSWFYLRLGQAYYDAHQLDSARQTFRQALEIDPGNEQAREWMEKLGP